VSYVDLLIRHRSLAGQAEDVARELAAIDRRLRDLLAVYLAQCAPERRKAATWRWEVRHVDEHGVLFGNDSFSYGVDTPGPRELLVPMAWIKTWAPDSSGLPVDDTGAPAHVVTTGPPANQQQPTTEMEAAS